jgi:hypothetical protein
VNGPSPASVGSRPARSIAAIRVVNVPASLAVSPRKDVWRELERRGASSATVSFAVRADAGGTVGESRSTSTVSSSTWSGGRAPARSLPRRSRRTRPSIPTIRGTRRSTSSCAPCTRTATSGAHDFGPVDVSDLFTFNVYHGGALVLDALRQKIGNPRPSAWSGPGPSAIEASRRARTTSSLWHRRYPGRNVTGFLRDWLYGETTPPMPGTRPGRSTQCWRRLVSGHRRSHRCAAEGAHDGHRRAGEENAAETQAGSRWRTPRRSE